MRPSKSKSLAEFKPGLKITVHDLMQKGYSYTLKESPGQHFAPEFTPQLSPADMLKLGVFEGHYLNDCTGEFPAEWFERAADKLSPKKPDISKNCFHIKSRLDRSDWMRRGWIAPFDPDIRGWFQWYCRYWLGRRAWELDERQIKRWRAFTRHRAQVFKNCRPADFSCRPRQRQALLQWAYDPFI